MEQGEHNVENQETPEFADAWKTFNADPPLSQARDAPFSGKEQADRQDTVAGAQSSLPARQPSGARPARFSGSEEVLERLANAARQLADAEREHIYPLALRHFLSLCGASRGVALTCHGDIQACRTLACQGIDDDLAALLGQEFRRLTATSTTVATLTVVHREPSNGGRRAQRGRPLAAALAAASAHWCAWLPLVEDGRVEAILIALGEDAGWQRREGGPVPQAAAVLGELTAAALLRARLRTRLIQEEHARDEFIGLASHELKSPLTIIKGYSQLLVRQAQRGAKADLVGLEAITQQVNRMATLVGELLDVSRIERGLVAFRLQPVELVRLARHVVETRQRTLPAQSILLVQPPPTLMVRADPARVEQVLGYLLDNALKFGGANGQVEVSIQSVQAKTIPTSASLPLHRTRQAPLAGQMARISIRDYGPGLPVQEQRHLFTPYYRGPAESIHRQLAGLGLGLYLSAYLVSQQHGTLWAEFPTETLPAGSVFHFTLPLLPEH